MANLFDPSNAPEGEPTEVVVGDFIQWKRSDIASDYPPATHSAQYVARITAGGNTEIQIVGTEHGSYYLFTATSEESVDFVAGYYHWQLEIIETASGNRIVVDTGAFTAIEDLDTSGADPRTHAEIMLDKIQSLLEGRADKDVTSYSIQGRSISKMSIVDLLEWRNYYRKEVAKEKKDRDIKNGRTTSTTAKVRFL